MIRGRRPQISAAINAGGFYRMAGPLLGVAVRRGIEKDLTELKRLMEARE